MVALSVFASTTYLSLFNYQFSFSQQSLFNLFVQILGILSATDGGETLSGTTQTLKVLLASTEGIQVFLEEDGVATFRTLLQSSEVLNNAASLVEVLSVIGVVAKVFFFLQ